ncbi:STAS domain-containing protein [Pseudomonas sp. CAN2814]|uniref:STAS domain-containing protein n=1 Tax=Pseudomonas sp. CAN1 TaxID=3046726 RepID=UPI0026499957|nr:STAS domain-containing protein [Pseudomonas sp. CAN1]MDN6861065.1 STAS domain-containing protein [Pseudomonas sp. CAN1]
MTPLSRDPEGRLALAGNLTIYEMGHASAALREAVLTARIEVADPWRLDLSAVEEIDTAGVQLLLSLRKQLQRHGAHLTLLNPSAAVRQIIDLLRLHLALPTEA